MVRASIDGFYRPRAERDRRGEASPEGYYEDSFDFAGLRKVLDPLGPDLDRLYRTAIFDFRVDAGRSQPAALASDNDVLIVDGVFLLRPRVARQLGSSHLRRSQRRRNPPVDLAARRPQNSPRWLRLRIDGLDLSSEAMGFDPSLPRRECTLTIKVLLQLVATGGNSFGLLEPFWRDEHLPRVATGCDRSAPLTPHDRAGNACWEAPFRLTAEWPWPMDPLPAERGSTPPLLASRGLRRC